MAVPNFKPLPSAEKLAREFHRKCILYGAILFVRTRLSWKTISEEEFSAQIIAKVEGHFLRKYGVSAEEIKGLTKAIDEEDLWDNWWKFWK